MLFCMGWGVHPHDRDHKIGCFQQQQPPPGEKLTEVLECKVTKMRVAHACLEEGDVMAGKSGSVVTLSFWKKN